MPFELSFVVPVESVVLIANAFGMLLRLAGSDNSSIVLQSLTDAPNKDVIIITLGGEKEDVLVAMTYILPKVIERSALLLQRGMVEANLVEWLIPAAREIRLTANISRIIEETGAVVSIDNSRLNHNERLDLESCFVINNNICQACLHRGHEISVQACIVSGSPGCKWLRCG